MRILWVSHSSRIGGAELSLAESVQALVQRGHDVHVVVPSVGPLCDRLAPPITVHVQPHNPWAGGPASLRDRGRWAAYDAGVAVPSIARIIRSMNADVVVTSTITAPSGAFAAKLTRRPHAWLLHEYGPPYHGLQFLFGDRPTTRLMNALSNVFMVASEVLLERFSRRFGAERLRRITFAVNVPALPPPAARAGRLRFVLYGQKSPGKGQHEAIEALAALVQQGGDAELILLGGSAPGYEQHLQDLAREHHVAGNVVFLPFTPQPLEIVNEADVVLMCSRNEGFGRVTVEAQKLGKPVLGARSGATPELVRHGETGLLYQPGCTEELAAAMRALADDRDLLARMGREARTRALRTFNEEACGQTLHDALSSLVSRAG
jgi:glycosyltransferase involved in cell wall biosynthesis